VLEVVHPSQTTAARPRPKYPPCRNCKWVRDEKRVVCSHKPLGIVFDVARAELLVRERPREAVRFAPRRLWHYFKRHYVNVQHVAHVAPYRSKPGIMGTIRVRGRRRLVPIEGHHRGYGALLALCPFWLYILSEEETASCIKEQTNNVRSL
jgi:hypothetical protein